MLADFSDTLIKSGALSRDVHLEATSLYELLDFIENELPRWRDRTDREDETSETGFYTVPAGGTR
jgi:hypothetical protein